MNEKDFAELSAGYALDALSPEDERAYHEALAAHPEWGALADADAQVVGTLADGMGEDAPPVELRARILDRIVGMPQSAAPASTPAVEPVPAPIAAPRPADEVPPRPAVAAAEAADAEPVMAAGPPTEVVQTVQRRNWTRGLFALVASAALLVGIGWGVGSIVEQARTPIEVQALEQIDSAPDTQTIAGQFTDGGEAVLHWSAEVGKAVITTDDLPSIDADRTFEMWFVRGDEPISAGTFSPGDDVTALLEGTPEPGDVIAVTVEQEGGSPDGVPTTDPIIAIPTA